jgi:hypothetical protein
VCNHDVNEYSRSCFESNRISSFSLSFRPFEMIELHRKCAFRASRLIGTTFLIVEVNDVYGEYPFIYVKVCHDANTVCILDTGCGGVSLDEDMEITNLREFTKTVPTEANGHQPLNIKGKMTYVVVTSHVRK